MINWKSSSVERKITRKYNPPASPHMGGAWERLVRSIQETSRVTLRETRINPEILCSYVRGRKHYT